MSWMSRGGVCAGSGEITAGRRECASDRLYKTELTADGVTNTRMIAQSETIRDAHWGFMPR